MSIRVARIDKHFGSYHALQHLDLEIQDGELIGLLGPSGSGKTTLLRVIAGLEVADSGSIHFGERDVTRLDVGKRRVGFVFQQYALFRHMTVLQNVGFGLKVLPRDQRPSAAEIRRRSLALLERVQLEHLAGRYPDQLSGGQRQRVALARALAMEPQVLLLDEPFGALDAKVRKELRIWLRELHDELHFTSVFVTHDQEEALELSDRVVVMNAGRIEQVASPGELYARPASRFVLDFLGDTNVLRGELRDGRLTQGAAWLQTTAIAGQGAAEAHVRNYEMTLKTAPSADAHLPVTVKAVTQVGGQTRVALAPEGWDAPVLWELVAAPDAVQPEKGATLYAVPRAAGVFLEAQGGAPQWLSF